LLRSGTRHLPGSPGLARGPVSARRDRWIQPDRGCGQHAL